MGERALVASSLARDRDNGDGAARTVRLRGDLLIGQGQLISRLSLR